MGNTVGKGSIPLTHVPYMGLTHVTKGVKPWNMLLARKPACNSYAYLCISQLCMPRLGNGLRPQADPGIAVGTYSSIVHA